MSEKRFVVYVITNLRNGKRYVGKTNDVAARWRRHRSSARKNSPYPVHVSLRKYGREAFSFMIVRSFSTEAESFASERAWIAEWRTTDPNYGYNLSMGGEGPTTGIPMPEHTKQALAAARPAIHPWLGKRHRPETIEKMRASMKGKRHNFSDEGRASLVESARRRMQGKRPSEAAIQKSADMQRGVLRKPKCPLGHERIVRPAERGTIRGSCRECCRENQRRFRARRKTLWLEVDEQ